jgi:hypothetical protein
LACLKPPREALQGRTACEKNGQAKACVSKCHDRLARGKASRGGFELGWVYSYKSGFFRPLALSSSHLDYFPMHSFVRNLSPPGGKHLADSGSKTSGHVIFYILLLAITLTACKDNSMPVVAVPVFNPPFGEVAKGTVVTVTCKTEGAEIWYTKNGTDPTRGPIDVFMYTAPFVINETTTIKAIAVKDGYVPSSVKKAEGVYIVPATSSPLAIYFP